MFSKPWITHTTLDSNHTYSLKEKKMKACQPDIRFFSTYHLETFQQLHWHDCCRFKETESLKRIFVYNSVTIRKVLGKFWLTEDGKDYSVWPVTTKSTPLKSIKYWLRLWWQKNVVWTEILKFNWKPVISSL